MNAYCVLGAYYHAISSNIFIILKVLQFLPFLEQEETKFQQNEITKSRYAPLLVHLNPPHNFHLTLFCLMQSSVIFPLYQCSLIYLLCIQYTDFAVALDFLNISCVCQSLDIKSQ